MNKFSLVSMALSVLFCSFANATDQSVTSVPQGDAKGTATPVEGTTQTVKNDNTRTAGETTQTGTEKLAVSKKIKKKQQRRCRKTKTGVEQTNKFTKMLNSGEKIVTEPANTVRQQTTTPATPSTDASVKA